MDIGKYIILNKRGNELMQFKTTIIFNKNTYILN